MKTKITVIVIIAIVALLLISCSNPRDIPLIETPQSTCFSAVGYNKESGTLVVRFRESGAEYAYYGVDRDEWNSFRNSDSLGSYFNENIKGEYEYERID